MFNRPGPRKFFLIIICKFILMVCYLIQTFLISKGLVDALEWLVGYINDIPEIIPKDFPWQNLKS